MKKLNADVAFIIIFVLALLTSLLSSFFFESMFSRFWTTAAALGVGVLAVFAYLFIYARFFARMR